MKLRFFLFDESVTDFRDCIRVEDADLQRNNENDVEPMGRQLTLFPPEDSMLLDREPDPVDIGYRQLQLSVAINNLDFAVEAWVLEKSSNPLWFLFIEDYVSSQDTSRQAKNTTDMYGMVVLIKLTPENRIFAVSFGYGYQFIRYERLESGFGRRVALNTLSRDGLRTLDVHNIDLVTRKKRIHINKTSDISDFRLDGEDVIVTGVTGVPEAKYDLRRSQIEGTDSLLINTGEKLRSIGDKCRHLLKLYRLTTLTGTFPELTRLLPITGSQRQHLQERLIRTLDKRLTENISLMVPALDYVYGVSNFAVFEGAKFIGDLPEFELETLYKVLDKSRPYNWPALRIGIFKEDESKASTSFPLLDGMIYLYEDQKASYLYSFGYWYGITQDYHARLTRKISEIPTFTLPPMQAEQAEEDYNKNVANERQYCLLDKVLINLNGRNRIEAADLVTKSWEFICVKKASKSGNIVNSSTLSHLFAQGSTSAILLTNDSEYRKKLAKYIREKQGWRVPFSAANIQEKNVTFVYAIATSSHESLAERLPLFSKITLLSHTEEIRKLGYDVKLCSIQQL